MQPIGTTLFKNNYCHLWKEVNLESLRSRSVCSLPPIATSPIYHWVFSQRFFNLNHTKIRQSLLENSVFLSFLSMLNNMVTVREQPAPTMQPLERFVWRPTLHFASRMFESPIFKLSVRLPTCVHSTFMCQFICVSLKLLLTLNVVVLFTAIAHFKDIVVLRKAIAHFKDIVVANDHDWHSAAGRLQWSFLCPVDDLGLLLYKTYVKFHPILPATIF